VIRAAVMAATLALGAAAAHADDARERAGALVDQGVALYRASEYRSALVRFEQAYDVYPSPKILFNLASALERLGRHAEAAQLYDRFLIDTASAGDVPEQRKALARRALAGLEQRLGRIVVAPHPGLAGISVDALPVVLRADRPIYVAPGIHTVSWVVDGVPARSAIVDVAAGEQRRIDPGTAATAPPARPVALASLAAVSVAAAPPPRPRRGQGWTWIAAGGSVALAGGGVVAGLAADSAYEAYRRAATVDEWSARRRAVERRAAIANALFAGAGVAVVTAGVLFFVNGREARVTVTAPAAGGIGVSIAGSL